MSEKDLMGVSEPHLDNAETAHLPPPTYDTVVEWWDEQSAVLTKRDKRILSARFPDHEDERLTLQELGEELGVTRERVRQVRNRAFEKLQDERGIPESVDQGLWERLAGPKDYVSHDLESSDSVLRGLERLYLTVQAGGVEEWLQATSEDLGNVYYRGQLSRDQIAAAAHELEDSCEGFVARRLGNRKFGACPWDLAAAVSDVLVLYRAYACRRPLTSYRRRALQLHELLLEFGRPVSLLRLWVLMRHRDSALTVNDVQRTVGDGDFSHLFVDCGDFGVAATGGNGPTPPRQFPETDYLADISPEAATALMCSPPNEGDTTITGQLASLLAAEGPMSSRDLISRFRERTEGRYPESSAAAVLTIHGAFVRLAPGVYGLPRHVLVINAVSETADLLRNERDLYWYVLARHAGEPLNAFPLWTAGMEFEWVRWAEGTGPSALFERLLSVAEPTAWPAAEAARNRYLADRVRIPGSPMTDLADDLDVTAVDPERLLAIAMVVRSAGQMNWVRANRILGKRLDASTGVTAVGVLMLLGVIEPSSDWWRPHEVLQESPAQVPQAFRALRAGGFSESGWPRKRFHEELFDLSSQSNVSWLRDRLRFEVRDEREPPKAPLDLDALLEHYSSLKRREAHRELVRQLGEEGP